MELESQDIRRNSEILRVRLIHISPVSVIMNKKVYVFKRKMTTHVIQNKEFSIQKLTDDHSLPCSSNPRKDKGKRQGRS
jgi:hypothetical protein